MTIGTRPWLGIGAVSIIALLSLVAVSPPAPGAHVPVLLEASVGAAAGCLLFVLLTRRRPLVGARSAPVRLLAARWGILGLLALDEELLWRRIGVGELLFGGPVAAVSATTVGFALAHRRRPELHLLTGGVFGGLYVATGGLATCIVAHWVYNLYVLSSMREPRVARGVR